MAKYINSPDVKDTSYLLTNNDIVVDVGYAFAELTGYSKADFFQKDIAEIIKLLRMNCNMHDLKNNKSDMAIYLFTKSCEAIEVIITVNQSESTNEKRYIIEEKPNTRLENKFLFVEQLYQDNIIGVAIHSIPELLLLKANQKYLDFQDFPNNDIKNCIGKSFKERVSGFEGSMAEDVFKNIIATGKSFYPMEFECEHFKRGITYWDASLVPIFVEGKVKYIIETASEVTDRIGKRKLIKEQAETIVHKNELLEQANKEFLKQRKQLEAIIENMSDVLGIIDKNGAYINLFQAKENIKVSRNFKNIGDSYEQGRYFDDNGNEISKENLPICKVARGEKVKQENVKIIEQNKTSYFEFHGTPIFDSEGHVEFGVVCGWDITEKKRLEELEKIHAEYALMKEIEENKALENALQIKDEFLSLISHEFKTPLIVINSAVQALELVYGNELSPKVRGFIKKIKQNAFRQMRLVNNLLDISRANAGQIKMHMSNADIVFLSNAIVYSVKIYAEQKGIILIFRSSLEKKMIRLDEEKYERILLNLISNAIKFTPAGKKITVEVSQKIMNKRNKVCIAVRDEGVGIPKDKQSLIFDKFRQIDDSLIGQAEGTGIGLSVAKKFVEALDGEIIVDSEVGKGSTFTIILPVIKENNIKEIKKMPELMDNRLIQSATIEFSDIYF